MSTVKAKHYATTYSNGHTVETNCAHEAHNWCNVDTAQTFQLNGLQVTAVEFFATARAGMAKAWDKKAESHCRVSVQRGATQFGRVEQWVRK